MFLGRAATLLLLLLLCLALPAGASGFTFTATDYSVGNAPTDIDIGDLDGVNGPDIVYTTAIPGQNPDGRVVRRLNLGGGTFGAEQSTVSCNFGYELILHNFTPGTDSNLDALTTCGTLRGDGSGNFATPPDPTNNGSIQEALTLAQIQPGGNPELVYGGPASGNTNRICFALWSSPDFSSSICGNPTSPDPPFSFSNQPRPFRRFSFAGTNAVPLDNEPAGDPPRDDIITESNESADKINIYGRDPAIAVGGTSYAYQGWSDATRTTSAGAITGVASGDVNGDGTTDVLVSHGIDTDPRFDLFIWDPAVGLAITPTQTPTIVRPEEIIVRDFDGDGFRDVVLANGVGQLALHAGNGDGTFDAPEIFPLTGGNGNVDLVVGDVSGDGKPDIVAGEARVGGVGNLVVFINGTAAPAGPNPPGTPPVTPGTPPPGTPLIPDITAPETTITKGPKPESKSSKATFKFKSSEPGSKFECKLDKAPYSSCSSPEKLAKLGLGKHKFAVRAIDAAGNVDPTPARGKFKVVDK